MKKIVFGCLLLFTSMPIFAQKCGALYFSSNKKNIQLANFTKRGDDDGQIVYKISNISSKGNITTSQVSVQAYDRLQKLISTNNCNAKCNGNTLLLDMKFYIPQQQLEQFKNTSAKEKSSFLEYPGVLKIGDKLKDGIFEIDADKNGVPLSLHMEISDRTITGSEKLSTSAGTWDCFIIKYKTKLQVKTGPISIPIQFETTEWFNVSMGILKTTNSTGYAEVVAIN